MQSEDGDAEPPDLGGMPDRVHRRCTDVHCSLLFAVCFVAWLLAMAHAVQRGDVSKLNAFEDGEGKLCKLGSHKPYLFFCFNQSGKFDLYRPICRASCPSGSNTSAAACGGVPDYDSYQVMGMLCLPQHLRTIRNSRERRALESWAEVATTTVLSRITIERWRSLVVCSAIAIAASYIMIYILERHARCLVQFGLCTLTLGTLLYGLFLLEGFQKLRLRPAPSDLNGAAGASLLVMSLLFFCVGVGMRDSVDNAVDCIELACQCVMETQSLALQPLIMALVHFACSAVSIWGVLLILSCGRERLVHGTVIGFELSGTDKLCLLFFVFMWLWLHQAIFAMSEFVIAYTSAIWYFQGMKGLDARLQRGTLFKAYWAAYRYHMGTIFLGSFVISYSRIFRMTVGPMVSWTGMNTNPVARFFRHFCCCFIDCYEKVNPLSKNAFIDVAMNARPFFRAAWGAEAIVQRESGTIRILNGATWLFQLAGLAANAGLAACAMLFYSSQVVGDDPAVTVTMCVAGAFAAVSTALPFAMIFDTVSDTLFYCMEVRLLRSAVYGRYHSATKSMATRLCPCIYRPPGDETHGGVPMELAVWQAYAGEVYAGEGYAGEAEREEEAAKSGYHMETDSYLLPPEALVEQARWLHPPAVDVSSLSWLGGSWGSAAKTTPKGAGKGAGRKS